MMVKPTHPNHDNKGYLFLLYGSLFLALIVVALGAFTRLTEAGLGCPDWPGCYGFLTVPQSAEHLAKAVQAFPDAPVEVQKAWNEMIHRYVAGTLGLLVALIAFLAWRKPSRNKMLPSILLAVICFQAALGMWTVTMNLMPIVVMGHLLGGFTTVTLLFLLCLFERRRFYSNAEIGSTSKTKAGLEQQDVEINIDDQHASPTKNHISGKLKLLAVSALVAVGLQIALGGWTSANYAAVVCTQLPVCEADWVGHYDASAFHPISPTNDTYQYGVLNFEQRVTIHATHRIGAMVVSVLVLLLAFAVRRPLGVMASLSLVAALLLQVSLGVTNVVALLPLSVAVAHNVCGLLLLLLVVKTTLGVFARQTSAVRTSLRESGRLSHG
ncbi:COX15/CtaA family protein [Enterovibrio norvegicus]|uniref:COX15/CtaA family protein n=1 Tax=Enterovibrio norvegicus TaxID=188144 RepID=UPI000C854A28|nr:COX15/CtaA family protein [Enterovibrio norvegicus]PMN69869.1 cytochrome B [Enterovibrio norvegicus]